MEDRALLALCSAHLETSSGRAARQPWLKERIALLVRTSYIGVKGLVAARLIAYGVRSCPMLEVRERWGSVMPAVLPTLGRVRGPRWPGWTLSRMRRSITRPSRDASER